MVSACVEPLQVVDLMKLYGRIHFTWNLRTDQIVWNGPIHKLFGSDRPLASGSSFLGRLSPDSFWKRFNDIDKRARKEKDSEEFSSTYMVTLPDQTQCQIVEDAELIKTNRNLPERLEGTIRVTGGAENIKNFSGYDTLTGYPSQELVYENLAVLLQQTKNEEAPGGYLLFCIDKLSLIYFLYGLEALKESLVQVGYTLKKYTRFNDVIGRTSGCTFGVTIKDADEWGVMQAANRLINTCTRITVNTPVEKFSPIVSVGGAAFRQECKITDIILEAEKGLFDMQNMRGTDNMYSKRMLKQVALERPSTNTPGKRRLADQKFTDQEEQRQQDDRAYKKTNQNT